MLILLIFFKLKRYFFSLSVTKDRVDVMKPPKCMSFFVATLTPVDAQPELTLPFKNPRWKKGNSSKVLVKRSGRSKL